MCPDKKCEGDDCEQCSITYELNHGGAHLGSKHYNVKESKKHRWGYLGCGAIPDANNKVRENMGMGAGVPTNNGCGIGSTDNGWNPEDNAGFGPGRSGWLQYLLNIFTAAYDISSNMCEELCCSEVMIEFKCSAAADENERILVKSGIMTQAELDQLCGRKLIIVCEGDKCSVK